MRERLLSKKEPEFNDLGNSQPIQIVNDAKIRRYIIRKACFGEKAKNIMWQRGIKVADGTKVDTKLVF